MSAATLSDYSAQQISFSHLTILTAGEIFAYMDLENDFDDINSTQPVVTTNK